MKQSENELIWEAYGNPPMSDGGWSQQEVDRYHGAPKVTGVSVHNEFSDLSDEELQSKYEAIQQEIARRKGVDA